MVTEIEILRKEIMKMQKIKTGKKSSTPPSLEEEVAHLNSQIKNKE